MSQEDLADKLGVTRQTVSKWELDQSTPELSYIAELATTFSVTTDYLIMDKAETPETEETEETKEGKEETAAKPAAEKSTAPVIALSIVLASVGVIGVLSFIILSVINPWTYGVDYYTFEGVLGYVLGTRTLPLFIIFILFFHCMNYKLRRGKSSV